ncbi:ankyrin repeat-containing domain protein [Apiosordaria backusii]|uniref:Ankyrin repeat-containing domain protein n=1 Tax=Apiosordaria backusii TaxID=314023 RepID=A0AA40E228_9PEZI|nr:ankyrin repeat-containing domain protein [Apiosordaria backusii]
MDPLSLAASVITVASLQEDLRTVKSSLNILLGASNSQDMVKIRLEIQELSSLTTRSSLQSTQEHLAMSKAFMTTMAGIDERVARVEALIRAQTEQLHERQFSQLGSSYNVPAKPRKRQSIPKYETEPATIRTEDSIGVRVRPFVATWHTGCRCWCHTQQRSATPAVLNNLLGRLFVGYSGLPVLSQKCDNEECRGVLSKQISMEYWFPISLWSTIIRLQLGTSLNGGPTLHLETFRRIPDTSQSVDFAQKGNMLGLQHLFRHGLASPRDVSNSRGYTLLRWALYAKQYETVKFLVHAGADPDYRPISESDNSPRIKACHFLLEGGLSETATDALRTITRGSEFLDDFIDASNFTKLHKIVLGLSLHNLEDALIRNPGDMNVHDSMGRTPLAWAAAKGDIRMVAKLLSYGADPNIMDVQLSGPLSNAAAQGHTACVELLLEAGADPDPVPPKGVQKGSPLSVASRNSRDATLLKRLLDFGADVNTRTVEGKTPLFHATRNDNASFAMLLLEYGADLNATTITGETPLTTAITYNSHNVLRLFLDRWSEYSVCPRLKGPNLVKVAAFYGDVETMDILAKASHFQSKHDKEYTLGDFKSILRQRVDVTEELVMAFDELLSVINAAPDMRRGEEDLMEAGFFSCLGSRSNTLEDGFVRKNSEAGLGFEGDEDSVESFQDAIEKLELIAAEDVSCVY